MEGMVRSAMCPRCGLQPEDDKHRFWQCPCNDLIAGKAMEESAHLVQWACEDFDKWPVFWARGIMPQAMLRIPEPSDELATWAIWEPGGPGLQPPALPGWLWW